MKKLILTDQMRLAIAPAAKVAEAAKNTASNAPRLDPRIAALRAGLAQLGFAGLGREGGATVHDVRRSNAVGRRA